MDEIKEKIERVLDMFETSFIHEGEELILNKKWNVYFRLPDIESASHFDYKLISYLSFYTASNHYKKTSAQCKWAWERLNRWFRKDFAYSDLQTIYQKIGCGANIKKGIAFISSGLNINILEKSENNMTSLFETLAQATKPSDTVVKSCRTCWYEAYADREPCMYCMAHHCWKPKWKEVFRNAQNKG